MAVMNWTPEQKTAIEVHGGDILVSAAAGSGKTAVLVQRVVEMMTRQENPVAADRLLMVTFTKAAAAEMKQRISRRLSELAAERPGDPHLARQLLLMDSAQISTIHSFCGNLLREHFQTLGLPADFQVIDQQASDLMEHSVLKDLIDEQYRAKSQTFYDLVEQLCGSRSDQPLEDTILRVYRFLRCRPFYETWVEEAVSRYRDESPFPQTVFARILLDRAEELLDYALGLEQKIAAQADPGWTDILKPVLAEKQQLERALAEVRSGDWDRMTAAVSGIQFGTLRMSRKGLTEQELEQKEQLKKLREEAKKVVQEQLKKQLLLSGEEEYQQDRAAAVPILEELFRLTLEFDARMKQEKLEKGVVDFSDLEQDTLELLYEQPDEQGVRQKSALARELQRQYEEILIDEYQDTNHAQEMIFRALSREEGSLFLVGDVKQSIYRFRQAQPENFLNKKERYPLFDGTGFPAKIILKANFRTRQETTGGINYLFTRLMTKAVGEMEYGGEDALNAMGAFTDALTLPVGVMLVEKPDAQQEHPEEYSEEKAVAREIRRILDSRMEIEVRGTVRPVQPGDICLLLRSPKNRGEQYRAALAEQGIGCWLDRGTGFLETEEIAGVVSMLKALANPLLDLELAAVLASPMYGFSSQQLAEIRRAAPSRKNSFYSGVLQRASDGDPSCQAFLDDFAFLRRESMSRTAAELLRLIYVRTNLEEKVLVMPGGEVRRGNLRLFEEHAAAQQQMRGCSLSEFVDYIREMETYGCSLNTASSAPSDVVSVMSIHSSKGLEFPVVFLCAAGTQFNSKDLNGDVQLSPELGFACIRRDNERKSRRLTLPYRALRIRNQRSMLAEEMRLLYVALTRAQQKLYLVLPKEIWDKAPEDGQFGVYELSRAKSCAEWISMVLRGHPCLCGQTPSPEDGLLELVKPEPVIGREAESEQAAVLPDAALVQRLQEKLAYQYPYQQDTVMPLKQSVSDLTHQQQQAENLFSRRPLSVTGKKLTPAERGIASHKFMQFADYRKAAEHPAEELARLRRLEFLSVQEAEAVELDRIKAFFAGGTGRRLLAAEQVHREIRFLKEFTPEELHGLVPEEQEGNLIVQGVADCVFVEGGKGVILDYKTDRNVTPEQLRERYETQLRLYEKILSGLLGLEIKERILWSFSLNCAVPV